MHPGAKPGDSGIDGGVNRKLVASRMNTELKVVGQSEMLDGVCDRGDIKRKFARKPVDVT